MTLQANWDRLVEAGEIIRPDAPLREVIERLVEREETHTLFVVDGDGRYLGLISLGNLLKFAQLLAGSATESVRDLLRFSNAQFARDVMLGPVSVGPSTPLGEVLQTMSQNHVSEVAVVDHGQLVGRVTAMDLLKVYLTKSEAGEPID